MPAISRTRSNALLDVFTGTPGLIADPVILEYQIFDISTSAKLITPSQVYPITTPPGGRAAVDLEADKLGTGHYVAQWTPGESEAAGRHRVVWYFKLEEDGDELSCQEDFDVQATVSFWGYCFLSELRDEGLASSEASDVRLAAVIQKASRMIERYTGRFFEPREQTVQLDGTGRHALLFGDPIISIETIELEPTFDGLPVEVATTDVKIYNRHLTQRLANPDDRDSPKIELLQAWAMSIPGIVSGLMTRWPRGTQNVSVKGVYGYTEYDGSPAGQVPDLLRHACQLMVLRECPLLTSLDDREDRRRRWNVLSERTREQSYTTGPARQGAFTGDAEIDDILEMFCRPPIMTAV